MIPKTSTVPHQAAVITPPVTENIENSFLGIFHDPNIQGNGNTFTGNETFIHSNASSAATSPFSMGSNNPILSSMACMTKNNVHPEYFQKETIFRQGVPQHGNKLFCSIKPSQNNDNSSKDISRRDNPEFQIPSDDCDDSDAEPYLRSEKRNGRRKIKIEFIEDRSKRNITFSKRRTGIMKKAYELSTLTGTQVLLLVASESGHIYTFATPKFQPMVTKSEGKNMIQECLNVAESEEVPTSEEKINADAASQQEIVKTTPNSLYHQDHSPYGSNLENIPPNQHLPIPVYPGIFSVPPFLGIHNIMTPHPVNWKQVVSPKPLPYQAFQNTPFANYQLAEDTGIRGKTEV
ncbi:MADS-box transcription factor [Mitosporidium daphniae]|uniref:MADS-box transcription factor n=1 Tax=Mitosporidium daphniae TaxID=1485682 RepID=A0A098VN19_9MICR|nr:MADS-box transcription factor [Mitosporidium daphniae]KGG50204.1 MADS-box transcription factor [Mitosporidium daphniae]|eukprot:XP_013236640.1 MADS-box transcription factor [Mitosporidium daphniae]